MKDSRIQQASACIDEARTYLADMQEEGVAAADAPYIDSARRLCNSALHNLNQLKEADNAALPGM